jgi:hypothetical protein
LLTGVSVPLVFHPGGSYLVAQQGTLAPADMEHVVLQGLCGCAGRIICPQRVHQGGSADRLPAVHGQRGQQVAFPGATQRDRLLARQLDWAEDPIWPLPGRPSTKTASPAPALLEQACLELTREASHEESDAPRSQDSVTGGAGGPAVRRLRSAR